MSVALPTSPKQQLKAAAGWHCGHRGRVQDWDRCAPVMNFRKHLSNCMLKKSILDIKVMTFFPLCYLGWHCFSCAGEQKCCLCSVHLSGGWHLRCGGILQCNRGDPMVNSLQTSRSPWSSCLPQLDCCRSGANKGGSTYRKTLPYSSKRSVQAGTLKSLADGADSVVHASVAVGQLRGARKPHGAKLKES